MKPYLILFAFLAVAVFTSCNNEEKYAKLVGTWHCTEWLEAGKNICDNNVTFVLNADKTYESNIGGNEQNGTYKIQGNLLYFYPTGLLELAVQILKLTDTELQVLMNDGGQEETLTLAKE